ncbi:MAG: DUF1664 domain-containing protein [Bifidobacteriaceae bacterium]|jgi:predicted  nucleic acid-binding Zn-ribbon protein|nr:DUF1664 domain-containing protein [Bifidobacteriaceae bacterium]
MELAKSRQKRDLVRLDKLQDVKQIAGLRKELDHLVNRINRVEDKQLELMEQQDKAQQIYDKIASDLTNITDEVNSFDERKRNAIKEARGHYIFVEKNYNELLAKLPDDLLTAFKTAVSENYGRAVVFYTNGDFEGVLSPVMPFEQNIIKNMSDNQIYILEETSQLVVKTNGVENSGK